LNGALVRFVATNLFDYILDTEELSVARAASDDLDTLLRDVAKSVATKMGATLVYAKASEALLHVQNPSQGDAIATTLEREFHGRLRMATGIAKAAEWHAGSELKASLVALEAQIRREQLLRTTVVPPSPHDGTVACDLDGLRPATAELCNYPEKPFPKVSAHTKDRYDRGRQQRSRILGRLFQDAPKDMMGWKQSFNDFEELNDGTGTADREAPASVRGKMCVIHADGNRFSECRGRLRTARGLQWFADIVEQAIDDTLRWALSNAWAAGKKKSVLPFHVLYLAGDELEIVVPARYALEVLYTLLSEFSQKVLSARNTKLGAIDGAARGDLQTAMNGPLTLAVGAVLCDTHEPIRRATRLAQGLCENAKTRVAARANDPDHGNVVDFVAVESGFLPSSVDEHRQQLRVSRSKEPLTLRPYTLKDFTTLLDDVRALKESRFPTGRVHAFGRALLEADSDDEAASQCWALYDRTSAEARKRLRKLRSSLLPEETSQCRGAPGRFVQPWLDRKELWDYVF
jgi:hypothetical protein